MVDHFRQFLHWIRMVEHTIAHMSYNSVDIRVVFNTLLHHLLSFNFTFLLLVRCILLLPTVFFVIE